MQVKYCNDNSIDFLARNRGHGGTSSLNSFKGLQIGLEQLQGIKVQEDGKTALLQGGAYGGPVISTLWDQGYVASKSPVHEDPGKIRIGSVADTGGEKAPEPPIALVWLG